MRSVSFAVFLVAICAILFFPVYSFADTTSVRPNDVDIVFVVDVSGSMNQTDSEHFVRDALNLGIDLAPPNSRVAILSVNYRVVSETELVDVSQAYGRSYLRSFVAGLQNRGNTNFVPGYERALDILYSSQATHKRIIFLGDFGEGGLNVGGVALQHEAIELLGYIGELAKYRGIIIDSIMWRTAPNYSLTASYFLALPVAAGGNAFHLDDSSQVYNKIETIYFENFDYELTAISVFGEAPQNLTIPLPICAVQRMRIFVSSDAPPNVFTVNHASAALHGVHSRAYAIADLPYPSSAGVNLTISPGYTGVATIYTLFEFSPLEMVLTVNNSYYTAEPGERAVQTTVINAEIINSNTGSPIAVFPSFGEVNHVIQLETLSEGLPPGHHISPSSTVIVHPYSMEDFGRHTVTMTLTVGDLTFGPFTEYVEIIDIRPEIIPIPIEEDPQRNLQLIVSMIVGCALILISMILFILIRKREKVVPITLAEETKSDYRFHGKLKIFAIIVDSGEREVRPFDFNLYGIEDKRISLRDVFDTIGGGSNVYAGLKDIVLTAGPEESLLIRNNSSAIIRVMGRNYARRSKLQLFYDQKCYVVFERDVDELEIIYKNSAER